MGAWWLAEAKGRCRRARSGRALPQQPGTIGASSLEKAPEITPSSASACHAALREQQLLTSAPRLHSTAPDGASTHGGPSMSDNSLKPSKTAIVTGGSRGLGRGVVQTLAARGIAGHLSGDRRPIPVFERVN